MYKIIGADGREYGPISADQLRQWIAEGRANAQTRVLPEGATEWKMLSELPEFNAAAAAAPPVLLVAPTASADGSQVNGPAIGLIVTAILGIVAQILSILMNVIGNSFLAGMQGGQNQALSSLMSGTGAVVLAVIGIVVSAVVLFGAVKMKKLENYGLAMTASILAMLPCSGCCLVGLPIGIWAVVVLSKPEVKAAFH